MWPLKIALDAVRGLLGSFGGFLSIAGIVVAVAGGIYLAGYSDGRSSDRVAQLEAQLAAEKDRARREAALRKAKENRVANLENAIRRINDAPALEGDGASCRLDSSLLQQLAVRYGTEYRSHPPVPSRDQ